MSLGGSGGGVGAAPARAAAPPTLSRAVDTCMRGGRPGVPAVKEARVMVRRRFSSDTLKHLMAYKTPSPLDEPLPSRARTTSANDPLPKGLMTEYSFTRLTTPIVFCWTSLAWVVRTCVPAIASTGVDGGPSGVEGAWFRNGDGLGWSRGTTIIGTASAPWAGANAQEELGVVRCP